MRYGIVRAIILIVGAICLFFIGTGIQDNPVLIQDLWRAIQGTQLELAVTGFIVVILFSLSIEIFKRNQSQSNLRQVGMPRFKRRRNKPITSESKSNSFWEGISTELIGAVISTVLLSMIVLIFQQYASIQNRKAELILQMGSPDNATAVEAVRQLAFEGWLYDGSLQGANLSCVNYRQPPLIIMNITHQEPILSCANLQGADLSAANLEGANLIRANLQGANLIGANLTAANLWHTKFDEATLLPDANMWALYTDMERFTNPEYLEFFDPCTDFSVTWDHCN